MRSASRTACAAMITAVLAAGCGSDAAPDEDAAGVDASPAVTAQGDGESSAPADGEPAAPVERPEGLADDVPLPEPILELTVPDQQGASLRFQAMVGSTDVAGMTSALVEELEAGGWTVMVEEAENQSAIVAEDGERRYEVRMSVAASGDQVLAEFLYDAGS